MRRSLGRCPGAFKRVGGLTKHFAAISSGINRVHKDILNLLGYVHQEMDSLMEFMAVLPNIIKLDGDVVTEYTVSIDDDVRSARSWSAALRSLLQGLLSCSPLSASSPGASRKLLDELTAWREAVEKQEEEEDEVGANELAFAPWLAHGLQFIEARRTSAKENAIAIGMLSNVLADFPDESSVNFFRGWLANSKAATLIVTDIWMPAIHRCILDSVSAHSLSALGVVDASTAAGEVDGNFLPLLVACDLGDLAKLAAENFGCNVAPALMPHARHTILLKNLLVDGTCEADGGYRFACFQRIRPDTAPMAGPLCASLLGVYAQMYTIMASAAAIHQALWATQELFVLPPNRPQASSAQHLGVRPEPIHMLRQLGIALNDGDKLLAELVASNVDSKGFFLLKSVAFCNQWMQNMRSFMLGARASLLKAMGAEAKQQAEILEECVPTWSTVLSKQSALGEQLAKQRVLDHPKRPMVRPLVTFAKSLLAKIDELQSDWNLKIVEDGTRRFVSAIVDSACQYLVVGAALNTVLFYKRSERAAKMSEEVLAIAAKQADFVLPPLLQAPLEEMLVGMPPGDGPASATGAATEEAKPPVSPKPKLPAANVAPSGPQATSSGNDNKASGVPKSAKAVAKKEEADPESEAEGEAVLSTAPVVRWAPRQRGKAAAGAPAVPKAPPKRRRTER